ncbi:MAG TPA: hypothetical protein PKV13_05190 [Propionicimonas sp.]|nr:hypothetical protein [Propionicimonas sp.]HRA05996.1 hypothetical protein [Propionicimonas sp.]
MNQPEDDRSRGLLALRAAGVSLGVLGATFGGVSGWFTLESTYEPAATVVVAAVAPSSASGSLSVTATAVHTRTGRR